MTRKNLFKTLKIQMTRVIFLEAIIDFFLAFVIVFSANIIYSIPLYIPVVSSIVVLLFSLFVRYNQISIYTVEDRFPHLREILRTCADNLDKENRIVNHLYKDLTKRLKFVSNVAFLNKKAVYVKMVLIAALCFGIVFSSSIKFNIVNFPNPLDALQLLETRGVTETEKLSRELSVITSSTGGEFDESNQILNILSSGSELSFEEEMDAKVLDFDDYTSTTGAMVSEDSFYGQDYDPEDEKTIKKYFDKLKSEG